MTQKKRFILLGGMGVVFILVATTLRSCILSIVHPEPWKVGSVSIPEKQMTVSLFFGSMQAALIEPYNGVHRILEISQPGKPAMYYDMPSLRTMDRCRLEVYWYPTNNLIRLKDTALTGFAEDFRSECLLDLGQNTMFAVLRGNGIALIAKLSVPMSELSMPEGHDDRIAHNYIGSVGNLGRNPSQIVTIGGQQSKPDDAQWTLTSGVLIGVISPKE